MDSLYTSLTSTVVGAADKLTSTVVGAAESASSIMRTRSPQQFARPSSATTKTDTKPDAPGSVDDVASANTNFDEFAESLGLLRTLCQRAPSVEAALSLGVSLRSELSSVRAELAATKAALERTLESEVTANRRAVAAEADVQTLKAALAEWTGEQMEVVASRGSRSFSSSSVPQPIVSTLAPSIVSRVIPPLFSHHPKNDGPIVRRTAIFRALQAVEGILKGSASHSHAPHEDIDVARSAASSATVSEAPSRRGSTAADAPNVLKPGKPISWKHALERLDAVRADLSALASVESLKMAVRIRSPSVSRGLSGSNVVLASDVDSLEVAGGTSAVAVSTAVNGTLLFESTTMASASADETYSRTVAVEAEGGDSAAPIISHFLGALPSSEPAKTRITKRGLRVLACDGGGVRGLIMIRTLAELERRTGRRTHDLFDLVVGTSTGGVLALGICSHLSLDAIERCYREMRESFSDYHPVLQEVRRSMFGTSHDAGPIEKALKGLFGENKHLLELPRWPLGAVLAATASQEPIEPFLFRTYQLTGSAQQTNLFSGTAEALVWQAARATSSAPTFFPPVQVGAGLYVDGAILSNNPAGIALAEAQTLLPRASIDLMVSLGTGCVPQKAANLQNSNVVNWAFKVFECAMSSIHEHMVIGSLLHDSPTRYIRLDPELASVPSVSECSDAVINTMLEAHDLCEPRPPSTQAFFLRKRLT